MATLFVWRAGAGGLNKDYPAGVLIPAAYMAVIVLSPPALRLRVPQNPTYAGKICAR